jgi:transposase
MKMENGFNFNWCYKDLEYIFCQLPNINFVSNDSVLEEYLPWADKVQFQCKINSIETNIKVGKSGLLG